MRRADRLFQIVQLLRRSSRPLTAEAIATELETSKRSVYRDIAALMGQRVPIRGEAGIGYVLDGGFDMPPLMLTSDEIEAAVLGAQWVASRGDPALARAARDLIAKIAATVPERLRPVVLEPAVSTAVWTPHEVEAAVLGAQWVAGRGDPALARAARDLIAKIAATVPERLRPVVLEPAVSSGPVWKPHEVERLDMGQVRAWIRAGRKLRIDYADEQGRESRRIVWPILVGYRETTRLLVCWCESRDDFRTFRTDRVREAAFLDDRYPARPAQLRAKWTAMMEAEHRAYLSRSDSQDS